MGLLFSFGSLNAVKETQNPPLWLWPCCSLTHSEIWACVPQLPPALVHTHTHTHTHTHASCSLSPHVCRHSSQCALHGGLLHSPSPWLASHLTLPLGKPLLMEASSDPSVRPAPLSRSYSLWPLSLAVPLSVQTSAITHSIAVNTRLLPWTGFQKGRQSISWFLTAVFPALVPTCNFWRENMAGGKPVCELRKFKAKARVLTRGHLSSLTLPCWCEGDQRTKTPWAP